MPYRRKKLLAWALILFGIFLLIQLVRYTPLLHEAVTRAVTPSSVQADVPTSTPPSELSITPDRIFYVDAALGSDNNPAMENQPWKSIDKAVNTVEAGDLVYIRGGEYQTVFGGYTFENSGTEEKPITLSNYPGEQVIIQVFDDDKNYGAFGCWYSPLDPENWQTPKADYIRIVATEVEPSILSNGLLSNKGIVIQGLSGDGIMAAGVEVAGCDNWEVAGIDFVDLAYGVYTKKRNFGTIYDYSPDNWYVHDNRVYGFYSESGMQFNGNNNLIENNEIYKVTDVVNEPYGCQMLNLLGHHNLVRGNTIGREGSEANCLGILFEWDLSDANVVEENTISDVTWGGNEAIVIAGGDDNIIRNNIIDNPSSDWLYIFPDNGDSKEWPCNEENAAKSILPAYDSAALDYPYYYPHNCRSKNNDIYDNVFVQE
ncbi:MAG: right-handed parallel beta-helix repeat-containing protein [Anaerolineales bacterium]|jgi:hypothetical protein